MATALSRPRDATGEGPTAQRNLMAGQVTISRGSESDNAGVAGGLDRPWVAAGGNGAASVAQPTLTVHKEAIGDDELAANVERLVPLPFFVCSRRGLEPPPTQPPRTDQRSQPRARRWYSRGRPRSPAPTPPPASAAGLAPHAISGWGPGSGNSPLRGW